MPLHEERGSTPKNNNLLDTIYLHLPIIIIIYLILSIQIILFFTPLRQCSKHHLEIETQLLPKV